MKFHFLLRKIFILGHQNPSALSGKISDTAVVGCQKTCISYRSRRMALFSKPLRQCRRQLRIHQEAHRSGGRQDGVICVAGCVGDGGADIFGLEIGKIP